MSDEQPNPFTPEQLEILFQSWALAARGMGQVLEDHAIPTAYRLAERGWLECRILDGVLTWW